MAELSTAERNRLKDDQFAYIDKEGERHLPIHDEEHVRNAIARFNQTAFESVEAKEKARRKVLAAAKRHGIEVAKDDEIRKAAAPLKRVRTKRGIRGGKKIVRAKRPTSPRQRAAARRNVKKAVAARRRR